MTTQPITSILIDLLAGQATASALAERIPLSVEAIVALLIRQQQKGLVQRVPICNGTLTAWRLTPEGWETARNLEPAGLA